MNKNIIIELLSSVLPLLCVTIFFTVCLFPASNAVCRSITPLIMCVEMFLSRSNLFLSRTLPHGTQSHCKPQHFYMFSRNTMTDLNIYMYIVYA